MNINFGKLCFWVVSFNGLLLSIPALSDDVINQQALNYAEKQLHVAISRAEDQAGVCIKKKPIDTEEIRGQLPTIDDKKLQYSLGYIALRYIEQCGEEAEKNVLYALSSLEKLVERFKTNDKYAQTIKATKTLFGGISPETATLRIRYYQLSEDMRNKLESIPQLQSTNFDALTLHEELTN